MCTLAAFAESIGLVCVLGTLAIGSTLEAIARLVGSVDVHIAAGYLFVISAIMAWWVASAMMFEEACGHPVVGVGKRTRHGSVAIGVGEPGVIRGQ